MIALEASSSTSAATRPPTVAIRSIATMAFYIIFDGVGGLTTASASSAGALFAILWSIMYAAAGVLLFLICLKERSIPLNGLFLSWATLPILSTIWSVSPNLSLTYGATFFASALLGAVIVKTIGIEFSLRCLLLAMKIAAVISIFLIFAFPKYGLYHDLLVRSNIFGLPPIQGVFSHKFSAAASLSVALLVQNLLPGYGRLSRGIWSAIFLALILSSGSAQFATMLLFCGIVLALKDRISRTQITFAFAGIVMLGFLVGFGVILDLAGGVLELLGRNAGLTGRSNIWAAVLRLVHERPLLGYGFEAVFKSQSFYSDNFLDLVKNYRAPHAHNSYLQCLLSLGYIGSFLYFSLIAIAMFTSNLPRTQSRLQYLATCSVIILGCVAGFGEITAVGYVGFFPVFVGMLMASPRPRVLIERNQ